MEGERFVCNLCCYSNASFQHFQQHYIRLHRHDPSFTVSCGIGACNFTTKRWNTYKVHVYRKHNVLQNKTENVSQINPETVDEEQDENIQNCLNIPPDNSFQNALYTMSLEARHNLTQTAIDAVVSSTSILLEEHMNSFKSQLKRKLEERNINGNVVDDISINHMLNEFDTSAKRYRYFEKCKDIPLVQPVEVILGTDYVTKKGVIVERPRLGYYVPFYQSLNQLIELPEVWNYIQNPHYSQNEYLYDICDGDYIGNNPLFQEHPEALQVMLNTDDLEIVNPLGCHVKKHKLTIFYYNIANIPPAFRSKLNTIQLIGIAKTKHVRKENGTKTMLNDFICNLNKMSSTGTCFNINGTEHCLRGALVVVPADTLASNWLGQYKEGVAFALKNCRACEISGKDLKHVSLDRECTLRNDNTHKERCDFLKSLSPAAKVYWSKMWGINCRSCLMDVDNFSITKCLVQDPMHVLLEGIVPRALGYLLFNLVYVKKRFTLQYLKDKVRSFPYSYLHGSSKPEDTFEKGDIEGSAKVKQSASAMLTLCHILPLAIGSKIPENDLDWVNFLRLIQIVVLCTSTYCSKDTPFLLRIIIAQYLRSHNTLYPKASFTPKMHFLVHFPLQMEMFGPLRHVWCMRFEGKNSFFKMRKLKNFKNLPYSLSRHHQLYMCMKQVGSNGEKTANFLYEGDIVTEGERNSVCTKASCASK